jgi:mRNA interferase MazF
MPGENVKRGEIYYVDFSVSEKNPKKGRRPVVVLQNDAGNKCAPTTIIASCTTTKPNIDYPFIVYIPKNVCGLKEDTYVHLEIISTIGKDELLERAGELTVSIMKEVENAMKISLGLDDISSDPTCGPFFKYP